MKLKWIAMLLIVASAQSALAQFDCSGTIYHFSRGGFKGKVLELNSFESIYFKTENAECIHSLKKYDSREICVELKVNAKGKYEATVERRQSGELQYAEAVLQDLQQGRYEWGSKLNTYLGNDLRSGRYSLATVVDVKNAEDDVIALGLNCR